MTSEAIKNEEVLLITGIMEKPASGNRSALFVQRLKFEKVSSAQTKADSDMEEIALIAARFQYIN